MSKPTTNPEIEALRRELDHWQARALEAEHPFDKSEYDAMFARVTELEKRSWAIFNPDGTLDHIEVAKLHATLSAAPRFQGDLESGDPAGPSPGSRTSEAFGTMPGLGAA